MTNEQRISCPVCGERILSNAKKCRFCGEWVHSPENHTKLKKKAFSVGELFWSWVTSILLFYAILIAVKFSFESANIIWVGTFGLVIALGVIIFTVLGIKLVRLLFNKEKRRQNIKYLVASPLIFILFFIALYQVPSAYNAHFLSSDSNSEIKPIPTPSATATPISTPRPTYTPPSKATVIPPTNSTVSPKDPVHCTVNSNCGGGTKPLTRSECDNSVCCEIEGKWIFYTDKNQCIKDQGGNPANVNKKKVPVFLVHNSTTRSCPEENVDAVKTASQQAKDEQGKSSDCVDKTWDSMNQCNTSCSSTYLSSNRCDYWEYNYDSFDACLSSYSEKYSSCTQDCRDYQQSSAGFCSSQYYTDYVNKLVSSLCD